MSWAVRQPAWRLPRPMMHMDSSRDTLFRLPTRTRLIFRHYSATKSPGDGAIDCKVKIETLARFPPEARTVPWANSDLGDPISPSSRLSTDILTRGIIGRHIAIIT